VEGPIWPGSVPRAAERRSIELSGRYRHGRRGDDKLYGRAVAIVRADRKSSADHLQERLGIRFMCAADLIERMEQDGILGAPVSPTSRIRVGFWEFSAGKPLIGKGRRGRKVL
jgi:DNA segregation ATPase FtsK/SpoIIIE-like protein